MFEIWIVFFGFENSENTSKNNCGRYQNVWQRLDTIPLQYSLRFFWILLDKKLERLQIDDLKQISILFFLHENNSLYNLVFWRSKKSSSEVTGTSNKNVWKREHPSTTQISHGFSIATRRKKLEATQIDKKRCSFPKEKVYHQIGERSTPYRIP